MPKNDIAELKQQVSLRDVASSVVRLENRGGEYWGCCPFHSEHTPSFAIKKKDGDEVFFCQGCGKGGDVITFIEMHENLSKKDAIARVRSLAGNEEWKEEARKVTAAFTSVTQDKPKITMPLAKWDAFEKALASNEAALKYLCDVRGIAPSTAVNLHLGYVQGTTAKSLKETDEWARNSGWICFPRIVGDKIVAVKMRSIVTKAMVQIAGMDPKALFNTETINPLSPVFVTEGEFDTCIMEQAGFPAVSIPNANTKLTPAAKILLKNAEVVFLAGDNDGTVGSAAMSELHRALGENTYLLLWPDAKDANEFFIKICNRDIAVFTQKVNELVDIAKSTPVEGFMSIIQRLRTSVGSDGANDPYRLHFPIEELDGMAYTPAGKIAIIFSTYTGTGKSIFTTQMMLAEAKRGEVVVVFSPELSGSDYLALVASQTLEHKSINRALVVSQEDYHETASILDQATERGTPFEYYVGHSLPESDTDKIIDFFEMVIKVTGCTRFVIDTLHRVCQPAGRESMQEAEGKMIKGIEKLGIKYGTIFILIGQSNKEAEDLKELRKDSYGVLRGSRELQDVASTIYLIHRKKKPETDPDQRDLLMAETTIIATKTRVAGPGNRTVKLVYRRECSKFFLMARDSSGTIDESSNFSLSAPSDEESPF